MWCDDCGRGECICNWMEQYQQMEEEFNNSQAQRTQEPDESNGWNDIWPPVPENVTVLWYTKWQERLRTAVPNQWEVQPWIIAKMFMSSHIVSMEVGSQVFWRDINNKWMSKVISSE
jgi:hypothetical protein